RPLTRPRVLVRSLDPGPLCPSSLGRVPGRTPRMSFLVPLGALALLAIPAIVLLYFLKVRRPEVKVATLMFWRPYVADRQANAPWQRLRFSLLLLLQLLAALVLAIGLTRAGLTGAAGAARTA